MLRRSAEAGQPGCFAYMNEQAASLHRGGAGTSPPGASIGRCASGGAAAASCGATNHHGASCSCGSRPKSSSRRFTYGLSSFDDETVERMLAVDRVAQRRVAQQRVLGGCSVRDASFSDVLRADRMQAMHQAMRQAMVEQRQREEQERGKGGAARGGGGGDGSKTLQRAAAETLDLLAELEKIGVYEPLNNLDEATEAEGEKAADMGADRSRRLASLPSLATVSIYEEEACRMTRYRPTC